jgi:hypothetical protein
MTEVPDVLYTAEATVTGGSEVHARTSDGMAFLLVLRPLSRDFRPSHLGETIAPPVRLGVGARE